MCYSQVEAPQLQEALSQDIWTVLVMLCWEASALCAAEEEKSAFQTHNKEKYRCMSITEKEQGTVSVRNPHYMAKT